MKTGRQMLREQFRYACERYIERLHGSHGDLEDKRLKLCEVAIRSYLFEKGYRAGKERRVRK